MHTFAASSITRQNAIGDSAAISTGANDTVASATAGNRQKVSQLETAVAEVLAETLRRGFFGRAMIEVAIQDGTIQVIKRTIERVQR